ncbi:hypothetical protein [Paludibacterium yongneupense]|uniref:hypothetical protein n=1 Tax=Paludibacterium yongneupense TaxID=400061 RepID=UPI00040D12C6|nr:hypothetical protein [Paludibacterium yongneupense]
MQASAVNVNDTIRSEQEPAIWHGASAPLFGRPEGGYCRPPYPRPARARAVTPGPFDSRLNMPPRHQPSHRLAQRRLQNADERGWPFYAATSMALTHYFRDMPANHHHSFRCLAVSFHSKEALTIEECRPSQGEEG